MLDRGWLQVAAWRGVPIRLHWSVPVMALVFSRFSFEPVFWLCFFGLILLHEMGHALLVFRYGIGMISIDVHGLGGLARHGRGATRRQSATIAWGGVAVQAVVLVFALLAKAIYGTPGSNAVAQAEHVLINTNIWLILLNLIPVRPFDGYEAWRLLPMLLPRKRTKKTTDEWLDEVEKTLDSSDQVLGEVDKMMDDIRKDVDRRRPR